MYRLRVAFLLPTPASSVLACSISADICSKHHPPPALRVWRGYVRAAGRRQTTVVLSSARLRNLVLSENDGDANKTYAIAAARLEHRTNLFGRRRQRNDHAFAATKRLTKTW